MDGQFAAAGLGAQLGEGLAAGHTVDFDEVRGSWVKRRAMKHKPCNVDLRHGYRGVVLGQRPERGEEGGG